MIANVSPAENSLEETLNTLKYANRAKQIRNVVHANEVAVVHHVSEYRRIISELQGQVRELKMRLREGHAGAAVEAKVFPLLPQFRKKAGPQQGFAPLEDAVSEGDNANSMRFVRSKKRLQLVLTAQHKLAEELSTLSNLREKAFKALNSKREELNSLTNPRQASSELRDAILQQEHVLEESQRVRAMLEDQQRKQAFIVRKTVRQHQNNPRLTPSMKFALDLEYKAHKLKLKVCLPCHATKEKECSVYAPSRAWRGSHPRRL